MVQRRFAAQQGSALIFALGFMVVMLIIAFGVHTLVTNQLKASGAFRQRVTAEYLAQGGVARAIAWFSTQSYLPPQSSSLTATVPVKLTSNSTAVVLPSNHPDNYTDASGVARTSMVTSYNSYLTSQSAPGGSYNVTASLMNGQPETWELLATAQQGGVQRQVGALLVRQINSLFSGGLFGSNGVTLSGAAFTDSYDSSLGAYGGANKFQTGNVSSNGNISLAGSSIIKGDAIPGPGKSVSFAGTASVTGLTTPAASTRTLPAVTVPIGATNLGAINLGGIATQTLTAGNYSATSLSITHSGQLIIDASAGAVNLYVTGTVAVAGAGIANASGLPANFFLAQVGGANVTFSNGSAFYVTVYAPNSALSVPGNGDFYGAFVGASISLSNSGKIHYDQNLRNSNFGTPGPLKLIAQWTLPS